MFKIARAAAILWPVTISLPVDGGTFVDVETSVRFKRMPDDDYQALIDRANTHWTKEQQLAAGEEVAETAAAEGHQIADGASPVAGEVKPVEGKVFNFRVLREIVVDWPELASEAGEPLAYDKQHLKKMVMGEDGFFISEGLFNAYNEMRFGARKKN